MIGFYLWYDDAGIIFLLKAPLPFATTKKKLSMLCDLLYIY